MSAIEDTLRAIISSHEKLVGHKTQAIYAIADESMLRDAAEKLDGFMRSIRTKSNASGSAQVKIKNRQSSDKVEAI